MAYIGKQPVVGNFVKLDAITTSATATYNLLNGGVAYFPQTANNCIVSLNGVIQSPTSAYTISGSTIVFDSALTSSDTIDFILVLGDVLSIVTPSDATVTNAKLALTAGSAGTPTISPAADTNTGIFFPAADTIGFAEGGTEVMRIDSDGDVGINTTSPESKLHVKGTSASVPPIIIDNTANGTSLLADRYFSGASQMTIGLMYSSGSLLLGSQIKPSTTTESDAAGYLSSQDVFSSKRAGIVVNGSSGTIKFLNTDSSATVAVNTAVAMSERMSITSTGSLILVGSTAQKASGTTWSNPSDTRLKDNKQNYTKGLNELLQINVKTWEWNGKAGTTQGDVGIGVIADEIETILPNTIDTYKAKLNEDDTEQTDVKRFDATEITWLLLNSVKEQQAIIEQLKARLTALES